MQGQLLAEWHRRIMNTRQKLKRNISTDVQKSPVKKSKTRKPLQSRYETPYPSALSESQAYKLPSSVGPYLSPSDFSPIPKAPLCNRSNSHRKTSSTNLKENATIGPSPFSEKKRRNQKKYGKSRNKSTRKKVASLESPFNSCSSSASSASSPDRRSTLLSDKGVHPNIPKSLSQSAFNSPVLIESPTRIRRPSAPTPPRSIDWKYKPHQAASVTDLHVFNNDFDQPRRSLDVASNAFHDVFRSSIGRSSTNFNRPPSQLSMYDYNRTVTYDDDDDDDVEMNSCLDDIPSGKEEFLAEIRGTSTPFKLLGALGTSSHRVRGTSNLVPSTFKADIRTEADTDTDNDSCGWSDSDQEMETAEPSNSIFRALRQSAKNRSKSGSGYITPSADSDDEHSGGTASFGGQRSPWISDSLISPPKTADWGPPRARPQRGAYMQPDDSIMDVDREADILEGMFDSMMLASGLKQDNSSRFQNVTNNVDCSGHVFDGGEIHSSQVPIRTRSLDESIRCNLPTSRNDHKVSPSVEVLTAGTRRTRSGTIVAAPSTASQEALPAPICTRRTRSGTVVASRTGGSGGAPGGSGADGPAIALPMTRIDSGRTLNGATGSGSSVLAPSLPIVEEHRLDSSGGAGVPNATPLVSPTAIFSSRRARSGSIVALSSMKPPLASAGDAIGNPNSISNAALPSRRNRSGSIIALGNALANIPNQAVGMAKRARSGTLVARAPALPEVASMVVTETGPSTTVRCDGRDINSNAEGHGSDVSNEEDVEMYPKFAVNPEAEPLSSETKLLQHLSSVYVGGHDNQGHYTNEGDDSGDDPLALCLIDSGMFGAGSARTVGVVGGDDMHSGNARSSRLKARARAAALMAKGLSKTLAAKNAKGKALYGPAAGAAAVARARARARLAKQKGDGVDEKENGDSSSEDELLLKPGSAC